MTLGGAGQSWRQRSVPLLPSSLVTARDLRRCRPPQEAGGCLVEPCTHSARTALGDFAEQVPLGTQIQDECQPWVCSIIRFFMNMCPEIRSGELLQWIYKSEQEVPDQGGTALQCHVSNVFFYRSSSLKLQICHFGLPLLLLFFLIY